MTMPEKDTSSFAALAEEFNESAKAFVNSNGNSNDGITMDGLLTKYNILSGFKVETPLDQGKLTEALFNCGIGILQKCAKADFKESLSPHLNAALTIFAHVTRTEELPFLPENAADTLINASLDLIRKTETVRSDYYWKEFTQHKNDLVKMAQSVIPYADKIRGPAGGQQPRFAMAKSIAAPAKRPVLTATDLST